MDAKTNPIISMFVVSNPQGDELAQLVTNLFQNEYHLPVNIIRNCTQKDVNDACTLHDLVLFDASVEPGNNYPGATEQLKSLDHIFILSRTYLPLNFYGIREGGAPGYPFPKYQTNQQIIQWLRSEIAPIMPLQPRQANTKGMIKSFSAMKKSLELQEALWKSQGQILISYRSRYYQGVKKLARDIEEGRFPEVGKKSVLFLPPGQLAYENEIMPEQRCWQFAAMIDAKIAAADEVWVFSTPDYIDSWWTRAELATLAYRGRRAKRPKKVRIVSITSGNPMEDDPQLSFSIGEGNPEVLPAVTAKQANRFARWYSNSDPGMVGPESMLAIRTMSTLPIIGKLKYFQDHVWTTEFWDHPLLPCVTCRNRESLEAKRNSANPFYFDLEEFLWLRKQGMYRLTPEQLERGLSQRYLECPNGCGTTFDIQEDEHPRCMWMPYRLGQPSLPDGEAILAVPVFRVNARRTPSNY